MQVHARSLAHIIPGNMPQTLWKNLVPLMEVVIALSGRVLLILFTKKNAAYRHCKYFQSCLFLSTLHVSNNTLSWRWL